MKKLHIFGIAFAAVFALVAFSAASAFAASEWLWEGASIGTALAVETSGELLLEDMNSLLKVDILCSGIFDGTVGPGTADKIESVLNLSKEAQTAENLEKKVVPAINCIVDAAGPCTSPKTGELIWVFPINLPWITKLELTAGGLWIDTITTGTPSTTLPGYEITCTTSLLGTVTDVCTGSPTSVETNEGTGVLGVFEESETVNLPGNCSIGGEKEALVVGTGVTTHVTGGTLAVS